MSNPRYTRHGQRSPGTADCAPAGPPRTGKRQDLLQIHTSSHFLMFTCSRVLMFSCSHVLMFMFSCSHVLSWQEARLASNPYTLILLRRAHGLPNHSFIPNTKYSLHTCSGNRRREASLQQDPLLAVEKQRDARDQRWRAPPRGAPRAPPRGAPRTNTWEIVRCCWPKPPWR